MELDRDKSVVEFYDYQSSSYDDVLEKGHLAVKIREYLQNQLVRNVKTGDKLLEIGCGTGTDAIFLAEKGIFITAIDPSDKMLDIAKQKIILSGLDKNIELINMRGEDISTLKGQIFNGAYSNFNALNHMANLKKFSNDLATLLVPQAKVFVVMLNKLCLIESILHFLLFKPLLAFKKLINRAATLSVHINLYFPRQVKKIFSDRFEIISITGFGIFLPPDNFTGFYRRLRILTNLLAKGEKLISTIYPFCNFGDHYLIELKRI